MDEVTNLLSTTIKGLSYQEPVLASSLKKWKPFFCTTVGSLHKATHKDPVDIAQDLLLAVVEANVLYQSDLYRYNKRLYEIDFQDGNIVRLKCPRYKKYNDKPSFWANKGKLTHVKKAKYDSFLYNVIRQQYMDILTLHFTQRNGWQCNSKNGRVKEVERICQEVSECNFSADDKDYFSNILVDHSTNPEKAAIANDLVRKVVSEISVENLSVFGEMLKNPGSNIAEISRACKLSAQKVKEATGQIQKAVLSTGRMPVYYKAMTPVMVH